jgi:PHD/YefM family antitoxin component YafN of YafNO toxin-antitoxin module
MVKLHPEFLTKNGKKEFAVLPYEEFIKIQELLEDLEDLEDLKDLRKAKEEEKNQISIPQNYR